MAAPVRYMKNTLPDYSTFIAGLRRQESGGKLGHAELTFAKSEECKIIRGEIQARLSEEIAHVIAAWPSSSVTSPTSRAGHTKRDPSVYVGSGGNAYFHWKLSIFFEAEGDVDKSREHLRKAAEAVEVALSLLPPSPTGSDDIAFYIGSAGVYTLAAVIFVRRGDTLKAQANGQRVLGLLPLALSSSAADEVLYGRAGYLSCLLFLRRHAGEVVEVRQEVLRKVFDAIVVSGRKASGDTRALQFYFYGTDYKGAAHGTAGILYLLLQFPQWCREPLNEPLIRGTLDRFLTYQYPSGNFASDAHDQSDTLVHWCHGAPGAVYTLHAAHQVYRDEKYKHSLDRALDVVWERGLLRKGFGLCHGTAGNAYAFLVLYRCTGNECFYYSAIKMAEFMWSEEAKGAIATWADPQRHRVGLPDFPFSLMEGLAGTVCFYCDLLHPSSAAFPGYAGDL